MSDDLSPPMLEETNRLLRIIAAQLERLAAAAERQSKMVHDPRDYPPPR